MTPEEFARRTLELVPQPKGVFPSEMYLFAREVVSREVDHIIESGVGFGGSTDYLDELFPRIKLTSIDRGKIFDVIARHPRVEFIKGDGRIEVLRAVNVSSGMRIAVLIDGPKGYEAMMLAKHLLTNWRVEFIAIHDLQSERDPRIKKFLSPLIRNVCR